MRHVGFSISTPGQQSPFCYWFTESRATVSQKSRRAAGQRHSAVRAHSKRITGTTRLRTFWSSIVVHRLRINKAASASFFFHASRRSVMGGTGGWGRRRDSLQQINISTHVSGPSAHRSGWKLLQSFLRRREMMPKPAWGEWNGPEQWRNWGTLEWGWRGWWGWVSLCIACCWHHHPADDHWGRRLQRHWGIFPPRRHGRDLIQLQNSPRPSNIPHAWAHAHSPLCLYTFFVCVFVRVVSQWPHVCVCMDGSHHDSERTGLFLQGRTGGKGQMLVCVKICLSDGYKLQFSGGYLLA